MAVGTVFIMLEGYRAERIKIWLNPEAFSKGYQTLQGLYAIGSGGLFGKGLGESMQKLGFLPEAQNDMIFSIICEELGLFGAVCVILLFFSFPQCSQKTCPSFICPPQNGHSIKTPLHSTLPDSKTRNFRFLTARFPHSYSSAWQWSSVPRLRVRE